MKRDIREAIGIVFFSIVIGLVTNQLRSDGIALIRPSTPSLTAANGERVISLQSLGDKLEQPEVLILDARSPEDYREGHIPGAKNVPYDEAVEDPAFFLDQVRLDQEIIVYCEGITCSNAEDVALLFQERGVRNVKVFLGGWEEWSASGMPVERESG